MPSGKNTGLSGMYPAKAQGKCFTGHDYSGAPATPVNVPGTTVPQGEAQGSGRTQHNRSGGLNLAGKGENLSEFPTDHQAG